MVVCTSCGTENPGGFRFCGGCGVALVESPSPERRERRVVSVLMVDLQGFTSRSERLDVEEVDAFLAPYRAELGREVERTGGMVSDFAGDGMMAVFGAPVAHEDDPERAVRTAIAIRDSFLDPESPAHEAELHVRLGITSGEVLVVLDGERVRATGDVVNTAARLEASAPPDEILIDEATFRATSRVIMLESAEPVTAKGKTEPVAAWRVVDARSRVPEQARTGGLRLVGRETEAELLRGALERSRSEPSAQLVSIIGEPGIGKSRLVEELSAHVEDLPELVDWRVGRSLPYGEGVAFWALGEMVKAHAGVLESDSADVAAKKLAAVVDVVILDERDRDWVRRNMWPLVGVSTPGERADQVEAFAAWRRFFESIAEDGPAVLVFEDLHWADDALLDFIDLLADRAGSIPLLIVCTARPELLDRRPAWGGGKSNALTISLTPLSHDDTARLVADLLDQALLPAEVQQTLLDRAEGNPLYAQEYIWMLRDRGILQRGGSGWEVTGEIRDLPESIQGIIAARLDTLTAEEKTLIQDASVIGKTAWLGACCALTERSRAQADELLHSVQRKQLLHRVRRSSIDGEIEFSFGHALTRDVAYSQIRRADRAAKHEAAAGWVEQASHGREDKAELLADHYQQALRLRIALGHDTESLRPSALRAFTQAARQARETHSPRLAAHYCHEALALCPDADRDLRAELLMGETLAEDLLGTVDEGSIRYAIDAQVGSQRWEDAGRAELILGQWLVNHTPSPEIDAAYERAVRYLERIPPSDVLCEVCSNQAYRLVVAGKPAAALALADRMIDVADAAGLVVGSSVIRQWRGDARISLGDPSGLADTEQAAETLAAVGHPSAARAYINLADLVRGLGDMPAANEAYACALSVAERFADVFRVEAVFGEQAAQAYHSGQWDAAIELLDRVLHHDNMGVMLVVGNIRGYLSLGAGDTAEGLEQATMQSTYGERADDLDARLAGHALAARCHLADRQLHLAEQECEEVIRDWTGSGGGSARGIELCETSTVLAHLGRHEDIRAAACLLPQAARWRYALEFVAAQNYAGAAKLYDEIGSQALATDARVLAAHKATAEGRLPETGEHANAVAEFAARAGSVYHQRLADDCLREIA